MAGIGVVKALILQTLEQLGLTSGGVAAESDLQAVTDAGAVTTAGITVGGLTGDPDSTLVIKAGAGEILQMQGANSGTAFSISNVGILSTAIGFVYLDNAGVLLGNVQDVNIRFMPVHTVDALNVQLDTNSLTMHIVSQDQGGFNFLTPAQSNPTTIWHAADTDTTFWGSLAHDGTNFVVGLGTGILAVGAPVGLPSFTVATLPSASPAGQVIFVSDETGGATLAFSDGTNFRRATDLTIVA